MKDCSKIAKYILGWYVCPQPDWSKDDWDKCSMRVCADVTHLVYTDTGVLLNSLSMSQVFFLISHFILSIWVNLSKLKLVLRWMHIVQEEKSDNLLHEKKYDKWTLQIICLKTHWRLTVWGRGNPNWLWFKLASSSRSWKNSVPGTLLQLLRCDQTPVIVVFITTIL